MVNFVRGVRPGFNQIYRVSYREIENSLRPFTRKSNCTRHMKYVHSSTKPYQCGVCGRELKDLRGLKSHMLNHK